MECVKFYKTVSCLPIDSDSAELPDVILMSVILFEAAVLKLFPVVPCTILSLALPA